MRVAAEVRGPVKEPYLQVHKENALGMLLRPGSMELGPRRSALKRITFDAGEMGLCTPFSEQWIGTADMGHLIVSISDAALTAACDGVGGSVELQTRWKMTDARLSSLLAAVNSERVAGFPSGRLFLDSVEQALAAALVNGYAVRHRTVRTYRGGLSPARLRRVKEFVHAKMEDELSLHDLAQSVELSTAHFSEMFRKSTGETPHQFVLRLRVERAQEMLRSAEARVLDVAVACGFKTQQHFARVFRHVCGLSPTDYRREFMCFETPGPSEAFLLDIPPVNGTVSSHNLKDISRVTVAAGFTETHRATHIGEETQAGNISRGSLFISSEGNIGGRHLLKPA
jgi:AraC family transcriptional regulator